MRGHARGGTVETKPDAILGDADQDTDSERSRPSPSRERYRKVPKTPRSTILVVDDEAEICDLVSYNLAREGYRVLQEHDGDAGLTRVFQSAPDLLILDLLLPKMSGLEVLGAIRGEPRTRALPVLVLTARGTEMDKLVGFERGADDYLTKPFRRRSWSPASRPSCGGPAARNRRRRSRSAPSSSTASATGSSSTT